MTEDTVMLNYDLFNMHFKFIAFITSSLSRYDFFIG